MEMPSRGEAEQRIRERAEADPAFRAELVANPRKALESELGVQIPEDVSVHVHEESLSEVHLVLPASQEDLSDADLEMVAGGAGWDPSAVCSEDYGGGV
jgi:hypothetical protein